MIAPERWAASLGARHGVSDIETKPSRLEAGSGSPQVTCTRRAARRGGPRHENSRSQRLRLDGAASPGRARWATHATNVRWRWRPGIRYAIGVAHKV